MRLKGELKEETSVSSSYLHTQSPYTVPARVKLDSAESATFDESPGSFGTADRKHSRFSAHTILAFVDELKVSFHWPKTEAREISKITLMQRRKASRKTRQNKAFMITISSFISPE